QILIARSRQPGSRLETTQPGDQRFVGEYAPGVPTGGERAAQFVGMPAGARAQDDDLHRSRKQRRAAQNSDARSTSGLSCPAWNVRPLDTLVSHTSAGLNSSGSIV